ncbi:hypothetical protein BLNAU_1033 [Blattamonas nauphoetae]|uniref:Secreted protein n=1 Tax=Blattamonas nauphoetae TaxID=2049346 RepID=A0ABQ9YJM0_9EUKA|nr:hypothetical protein BLNAU_1033 [Blattamonas nauphoetae]
MMLCGWVGSSARCPSSFRTSAALFIDIRADRTFQVGEQGSVNNRRTDTASIRVCHNVHTAGDVERIPHIQATSTFPTSSPILDQP